MDPLSGQFFGFIVASTAVTLLPGPDFLLLMRNSLRGGLRRGLGTATGTAIGLAAWSVAASFGLSAALAASRVGYDLLRIAGAACLIWLGATTLLRRGVGPEITATMPLARRSFLRGFANGVISDLCNPKVGVFYLAFLPAFIPAGADARATSLALGLTNALETYLWFICLVWLIGRGTRWLNNAHLHRRIERITGVVLLGFGVRLATEAR